MGLILKNKKHYVTRFPLWLLFIIFFAFSPVIVGLVGGSLTELFTDETCNEANCIWAALPWLTFYTVPIGFTLLLIFLIIIIIDSITLINK